MTRPTLLLFLFAILVTPGCAMGGATSAKVPAMPAALAPLTGETGPAAPETEPIATEQIIVEAWLTLAVDDVAETARAITAQVRALGGRVADEHITGGDASFSGSMQLRVPPAAVDRVLESLAALGDITSKRVEGTDVARQLTEHAIALENLMHTLARLRTLSARQDTTMADVLAIEREMTRVRGEIERIKGAQRHLADRVALATISVELTRRDRVAGNPSASIYPGVRASMLSLPGASERATHRAGAGLVLHTVGRNRGGRASLELDIFEDVDGEGRGVLATVGGAIYSDFLGRGRRRFLNPYLGMRIGYAHLGGSQFAAAATAGLELFKNRYVLIDASVRGLGLLGDRKDLAVQSSTSLVVSF